MNSFMFSISGRSELLRRKERWSGFDKISLKTFNSLRYDWKWARPKFSEWRSTSRQLKEIFLFSETNRQVTPAYDYGTLQGLDYLNVMESDSLESSHPISVEVHHPNQINELFDLISYVKGWLIPFLLKANTFIFSHSETRLDVLSTYIGMNHGSQLRIALNKRASWLNSNFTSILTNKCCWAQAPPSFGWWTISWENRPSARRCPITSRKSNDRFLSLVKHAEKRESRLSSSLSQWLSKTREVKKRSEQSICSTMSGSRRLRLFRLPWRSVTVRCPFLWNAT